MRVLILGGTRFIGPAVVRRLSERDADLTLFHRGKTAADLPAGVRHILGDRQHLSEFADSFRQWKPDVVLDMLPMTEQDARSVIQTFNGMAARIVAISSMDVYRAYDIFRGIEPGPPDPIPLAETAPLRPRLYPYRGETFHASDDSRRWLDDYDKILVERMVMDNPDLPGTALRLPFVYGPGDNQHRLFEYLKRMDDRRPAILLDQGWAHWRSSHGYVENVAEAIALAVVSERAGGRIYNVADPGAPTEAEWVQAIARHAGWSGQVLALPQAQLPPHLHQNYNTAQHIVADTTRIRVELGYTEPIAFNQALTRTIDWERANPPAQIDVAQFDYAAEDHALAQL